MRILLSGASGFLGSHLARAFVTAGHELAAVLRPSSSTRRLGPALAKMTVIDISRLEQSAAAFGPEAIVHAATCYGRRGESPAELAEANLVFPLRLLDCARKAGSVLFVNTDTTLPAALNAYALSKSQFVQWCRAFADSQMRVANVRLEYLYGPGDDDSKFPAHVVKQCVRGVPELALSPGEQMRDFIYVDDAVDAYLALMSNAPRLPWQDFGLGTGSAVTIRQFAEIAKRESGSSTVLRFGALPYRAGEPMRLCADVSALEALGWRHRTELAAGIRRVVEAERAACAC